MNFWIYILECADRSYYAGHTDNLVKRMIEHDQNTIKCYTSSRLPVKLVFYSEFLSRDDAFIRERQIKKWTRRKKRALIEEDWTGLIKYSQGKSTLRQAQGEREIKTNG